MKNQPLRVRLLFSIGLLMVVLPALINQWVKIPDFFRGVLMGTGLVMEIASLIIIKRRNRAGAAN